MLIHLSLSNLVIVISYLVPQRNLSQLFYNFESVPKVPFPSILT
jgi:hypothetical protein